MTGRLEDALDFYAEQASPAIERAPFRFLDAYEREDRDYFFGRDSEIEDLRSRFYRSRVFVVYGESGAGKTSLLQCGLANAIPPEDAEFHFVRSNVDPIGQLLSRFGRSEGSIADVLDEAARSASRTIAIVFDQFEELFLFQAAERRQQLLVQLRSVIERRVDARIIFCLREEFLSRMTEVEQLLPDVFVNRFWLRRMHARDARTVIAAPCQRAGILLQDGVADQLVERLRDPHSEIDLPYLQIVLDRLYKRAKGRDGAPRFLLDDLPALGTTEAILAGFLDERVAELPDPDLARDVLKAFVTASHTRRAVDLAGVVRGVAAKQGATSWPPKPHNETAQEITDVLAGLVRARILRQEDADAPYELRHDTLAEAISRWLTPTEEEIVKLRFLVESRYAEYLTTGALVQDTALLNRIEAFLPRLGLTSAAQDFVSQSRAAMSKRASRRIRLLIALSVVLLAVIGALVAWALLNMSNAYRYKLASQEISGQLIENADLHRSLSSIEQGISEEDEEHRPDRLLAILRATYSQFAEDDRVDLVRRARRTAAHVFEHSSAGDGLLLAAGTVLAQDENGDLVMYSLSTGELQPIGNSHAEAVTSGGTSFAFVSAGAVQGASQCFSEASPGSVPANAPTITIIDRRQSRKVTCVWPGPPITSLALSFDGNTLAAGATDGSVHIMRVTADRVDPLAEYTQQGAIRALRFHPSEIRLASAASSGIVIWDERGPVSIADSSSTLPRWALAWATDGRHLHALLGGVVKTWDTSNRTLEASFQPHTVPVDPITTLAVASDRAWVAVGTKSGAVWVWDPSTKHSIGFPEGHGEPITALAFSPRGILAVGDRGGALTLWDWFTKRSEQLAGHTRAIMSLAFTSSGDTLVSAEPAGGQIRAWRMWDPVFDAGFAKLQQAQHLWWLRGDVVATVDGDGVVVRSLETGAEIGDRVQVDFREHGDTLAEIASDPAGNVYVVTTSGRILVQEGSKTRPRALAGVPDTIRPLLVGPDNAPYLRPFDASDPPRLVDRLTNLRFCGDTLAVRAVLPFPQGDSDESIVCH